MGRKEIGRKAFILDTEKCESESQGVPCRRDTMKKSYAVRSSDDDSSFNDDESDYADE